MDETSGERAFIAYKEDKLFDLVMTSRLLSNGDIEEARHYLKLAEVRTQSGMRKEEIEAVSDRVTKTIKQ